MLLIGGENMKNLDKRNMPIYIIVLSLIFIFPLGIYYIVLKVQNNLKNIKKYAKILRLLGIIGVVFIVLYFIKNYSVYVSLIDSHMNLDMYNFNFIYTYIYSFMVTISCLVGSIILNNKCDKLVIYTEFINVRHIKDLDLIMNETQEEEEVVKDTINKLIETKHLMNVKLVNNHIVSTKTVDKNTTKELVKCKTCGNVEVLDRDRVRCDFCLRKLSKKDRV